MQKTNKKSFPEVYVDINVRPYWDKFVLIVNTISFNLRKRFQKDIRIIPGYINTSKNFTVAGTSKNFTVAGIGALDAAFIRTKRLWFAVDDTSDKVKNYLTDTFGLKFYNKINIYESNYLFYIDIDNFEDLYMLCKMMNGD